MTHPLDGSRAKIRQASKQLKTLNREAARFANSHPYTIESERDRKTGEWVGIIRAVGTDEDPPIELGVLVGDIAHNLRSALDLLVCQLAALGTNPDCIGTQFPICDSPGAFESDVRRHRLDGLSGRHQTMIRGAQPYHRRQRHRLLRILRELSNTDKHRGINPLAAATTFVEPVITPRSGVRSIRIKYAPQVRMKDGTEYARITDLIIREGAKVNVHFEAPYHVIYGEWGKYGVNIGALRKIRDHVRRIIKRFEPEFR